MAKPLRIAQHSWVGGMLNEDLMGRQDLAKYFQGATEITNFVVRRQGCLMKRGGTDIVAVLDGVDANSRVIPFLFDKDTGACLLFSDKKLRVFPEGALGKYKVTRKIRFLEKWWVSSSSSATYSTRFGKFIKSGAWSAAFPEGSSMTTKNTPSVVAGEEAWNDGSATLGSLFSGGTGTLASNVAVEGNGVTPPASAAVYKALVEWSPGKTPTDASGQWLSDAALVAKTAFFNGRAYSTTYGYAERIVEIELVQYRNDGTEKEWSRIANEESFARLIFGYNAYSGGNGLFYRAADGTYAFAGKSIGAKTGFAALMNLRVFEQVEAVDQSNEYATEYPAADLPGLRYCQSGDTVFLAHPNHPVRRLVRQFDGTFAIDDLLVNQSLPDAPAMGSISVNAVTSSAGARTVYYAATQVIDGVESLPIKKSADVAHFPWGSGGYASFTVTPDKEATEIRIYRDEGFGLGLIRILDAANGAGVSVKDIYVSADYSQEPPRNPDPVFDSAGGYPSCVSIYQQRMIFANTLLNPNRYWMSNVGDLYTFSTKRTITEDDAIIASLPLLKGPKILHLVTGKDLLAFTESCEVLIKPTTGNSLSYKTVSAEIQSYTGCNARLPPIVCEAAVLFADRAGQSVREFKYNYAMDTMQGLDVSVLSSGLFADRQIVDWCYQQFPDSNLLCVLSDGTLAVMTYMPDQEVYAWSRFEIAGFHVHGCCCSEALIKHADDDAVLPSTSETFLFGYDSIEERWLLLRMRPYARQSDDFNVSLCADLFEHPEDATPSWRDITSRLVTVYPDVQDGGVVERDKRVTAVTLRLKGGEGLTVRQAGVEDDGLDHTAPEAVNGLTTMTPQSDWSNCDGRVVIEHSGTDGCMIMSLTTALEVH